jgi:DNA-binding response OmpR family regulator
MNRILIAEDDAVTRLVVAAQLKKLGYETLLACDGKEAWSIVNQEHPRIIVTDWIMPEMDGAELCRRVRASQNGEYTYVILLTAKDRKVGYVEGMRAGADDFVTKPCGMEEFKVRLRVAERILSLQSEVRQLSHILPICPHCHRIRTDEGSWTQVEMYLMKRTDAQFSHGICPECFERFMKPQIERYRASKAQKELGAPQVG